MVTKQEISDSINENFPLEEDLDWTKMTKEDLLHIKPLLTDPKSFVKQFAMEKGEDRVADLIILMKEELDERNESDEDLKIGEGKLISKVIDTL